MSEQAKNGWELKMEPEVWPWVAEEFDRRGSETQFSLSSHLLEILGGQDTGTTTREKQVQATQRVTAARTVIRFSVEDKEYKGQRSVYELVYGPDTKVPEMRVNDLVGQPQKDSSFDLIKFQEENGLTAPSIREQENMKILASDLRLQLALSVSGTA